MSTCETLRTMPTDSQPLTAFYPKALIKKVDDYAKYKGVSRSDVMRWALVDFLHKIQFGEEGKS